MGGAERCYYNAGEKNQFILWLTIYFMVGEISVYVMIMLPSMWYTASVSNINKCCIWAARVVIMWLCGMALRFVSCLGWSHYSPMETFLLVKIIVSVQVILNECEQNLRAASLSSRIPQLAHVSSRVIGLVFESLKVLRGPYLEGLTSALSEVPWNKLLRKPR